jgi:hypothetical protein
VGVSIHYRGLLNDATQLPVLSDELADIADAMGWQSTRLEDDWAEPANARLVGSRSGARIDGHLGLKGVQIVLRIERLLLDTKDRNSEQIDGEGLGSADAPPSPSS